MAAAQGQPGSPGETPRAGRSFRLPPVLVAVLLLLPLALGLIVVGAGAASIKNIGQGHWFAQAIHSPLFLRCAVVTLVCMAGLALLLGLLWVAGRRARAVRKVAPAADAQSGGMIIEFVMILPLALMMILVMTQSSMLMGGNLCVNYAAYCATRSAIVTIPLKINETEVSNYVDSSPSSQKMLTIKQAAVWAVMPVSCSTYTGGSDQTILAGMLESAMDNFFRQSGQPVPQWVHRRLANQLNYADKYTEIELKPTISSYGKYRPYNREDTFKFVDADNKPLLKNEDYRPEDITVSVHHTFYLSVPYGNMVFAKLDQTDGVKLEELGGSEYGMRIHATCTLTNEGAQDWVDTEPFPRFRGVD